MADSVLRAYADVGMRVSFSLGIRDQNYLAYVDDETFIGSLPPELAADTRAFLDHRRRPIDEQLGNVAAMAERLAPAPQDLDRLQVAPTNVVWCSDRTLVRASECARQYGMRLNIHVLETSFQQEWARRTYGVSSVRHLSDLGLLGPDTTLSHAVWLTDDDIELIASSGTTVCHNASSNLRLRSGLAPIRRLAERGVNVAIGIDEAGINDDRDMLQEMRLVLSQQQVPRHGGGGLTAQQVLQMATEGGAVRDRVRAGDRSARAREVCGLGASRLDARPGAIPGSDRSRSSTRSSGAGARPR